MKSTRRKTKRTVLIILICTVAVAGAVLGAVAFSKAAVEKRVISSLERTLSAPSADDEEGETPEIIHKTEEKNGYELLEKKRQGDEIVCTFRVYSPDLYSLAKAADKITSDKDEAEKIVLSEFDKTPIVEKEVKLSFAEGEGGIEPIMTAEFLDAYYGGIYRLYKEAVQSAAEKGE